MMIKKMAPSGALLLLVLWSWANLVGCASTRDADAARLTTTTNGLERFVPRARRTIGRSVEGRAIEMIQCGLGAEVVLVLASIHGSEGAGTPLVERLAEQLHADPALLIDRTVLIMPRVNPDGLVSGSRHNAHGVDLNRNFPAENFRSRRRFGPGPLSEPESRVVLEVIEQYRPARIISIHQPLGCIDYDGPARQLAEAMAAAGNLPVRRLGTRPGSLGAYAGTTLGIPIVTLELPGSASSLPADELWDRYGAMMLVAIEFESP